MTYDSKAVVWTVTFMWHSIFGETIMWTVKILLPSSDL